MNIETNPSSKTASTSHSQATSADNVPEELSRLSAELPRIAHGVRMKSKGASAEIQDVLQMLEREVTRFGARVVTATDDTREELEQVGKDLRRRFHDLAKRIALPRS